jgi:hypothetical protein
MTYTPSRKVAKVIPITEVKQRLIATDERANRFIMAIGTQRIAFDFLTRITQLPVRTGNHPARVISMEKRPESRPMKAGAGRLGVFIFGRTLNNLLFGAHRAFM